MKKFSGKMKLAALLGVIALAAVGASSGIASGGTNTACFDWSCTGTYPSTCTFDPGCSVTNQGSGWRDAWTYGDGGSDLVSPGTVTTHVYTQPYPTVELLKYHFSGNSPEVECSIVARNVIGPPQALSGRCE